MWGDSGALSVFDVILVVTGEALIARTWDEAVGVICDDGFEEHTCEYEVGDGIDHSLNYKNESARGFNFVI